MPSWVEAALVHRAVDHDHRGVSGLNDPTKIDLKFATHTCQRTGARWVVLRGEHPAPEKPLLHSGARSNMTDIDSPSHVYAFVFACEPGRGSEPGVGFAFAAALAQLSQTTGRSVTLVTRPHTSGRVSSALADQGLADVVEVLDVSIPHLLVRLTRRRRVRLAYLWWQFFAVNAVKRLARERGGPAIVHHLTFATEALPTFEWRMDSRFARAFGPAGSSDIGPSTRQRLSVSIRRRVRQLLAHLNLKGVDLAIAQNDAVASSWRRFSASCIVEPNVAVGGEIETFRKVCISRSDRLPRTRLISVGRLISRKRHELAIAALPHIPDEYNLTIVGDGPEEARLRDLAIQLGVSQRVTFTGGVSRSEVMRLIANSDILIHCSRQEGAGWVVGEAQSIGVPPIAFKGSGADDVIRLGGIGELVSVAEEIPQIVLKMRNTETQPSDRWRIERLPMLLNTWYADLDEVARTKSLTSDRLGPSRS